MLDAAAHALHQEAHRLALDVGEALGAQNVVHLGDLLDAIDQLLRRVEHGHIDDEGLEVLVIVLAFGIVMRRAAGEIGFGRGTEAEQY